MKTNVKTVKCPQCGSKALNQINGETKSGKKKRFTEGFIEIGKYGNGLFEIEHEVKLYSCPHCSIGFAIL